MMFLKKWGRDDSIELAILLVSDSAIRRLNKKYRHKDKPTDVLSFPMQDQRVVMKPPVSILGDIVISVPTAKRDAKKKGISFEEELKFLLIHGFLHLLGYDHEISDREERRMKRKEKEYGDLLKGV